MTRAEWRKPRRFTNLNASVQTMPPMMSHTTMSGSCASPTGTAKNTTFPSQSAMGASNALILSSTVIALQCNEWHATGSHFAVKGVWLYGRNMAPGAAPTRQYSRLFSRNPRLDAFHLLRGAARGLLT